MKKLYFNINNDLFDTHECVENINKIDEAFEACVVFNIKGKARINVKVKEYKTDYWRNKLDLYSANDKKCTIFLPFVSDVKIYGMDSSDSFVYSIKLLHIDNTRYGDIMDELCTMEGGYVMKNKLEIKKVIFNEPCTIVLWKDGTKTVVRCQEGETYDKEKGLAMAIVKKALGNDGKYYELFKEYIPECVKEDKHE